MSILLIERLLKFSYSLSSPLDCNPTVIYNLFSFNFPLWLLIVLKTTFLRPSHFLDNVITRIVNPFKDNVFKTNTFSWQHYHLVTLRFIYIYASLILICSSFHLYFDQVIIHFFTNDSEHTYPTDLKRTYPSIWIALTLRLICTCIDT
jgi:hypothetical protein